MKAYFIKMYFKGGVLVPFYLTCVISLVSFLTMAVWENFKMDILWHDAALYEILKITFLSGLTSLCSLTIFLNIHKKIAENALYSFLSFTILPYCFIIYIFTALVEWSIQPLASLYCVLFFFHLIGPIISFQSFRATVLLNKNDKEVMDTEEDTSGLDNSDNKVLGHNG